VPTHPLAGQPAPLAMLINVPRLVSAYYTLQPDPENPAHQVAFGTSGHRGTSLERNFNEDHIAAICQAIHELRWSQGITGPLFIGMDTHALSEPALSTALEVFAGNGTTVVVQAGLGYTPVTRHYSEHGLQTTERCSGGPWCRSHTFTRRMHLS